MYELFLTALIEANDFASACAVLSGLCGMPPWETVCRILYFQGPPRPAGIPKQTSIDKPVRKDAQFLWKDLHQNLTRQSYILQLRYEVVKDRDMGPSAQPINLDEVPGMLRWTDFPDPPHGRPNLTQRKMVELWDQRRLPSVMQDNNHEFKAEIIEEVYRFFREDVEFCLSRQYFLSPMPNYVSMENRTAPGAAPASNLPSWDSLTPVDGQRRWILQIKSHVLHDNKPDEIRKAQDQLLAIRGELEGVFDFRVIDRKVHDTRVAQQMQGVQVLPQKVMLGRS